MLEVKSSPEPASARSTAQGVSIAEAARRTGVSVHTLRHYERAGLVVTPIDRTAGGDVMNDLGRHRHEAVRQIALKADVSDR